MKWFKTFEDFRKSQNVIDENDIDDYKPIDNDEPNDSDVDNNGVVYIDNWEKY